MIKKIVEININAKPKEEEAEVWLKKWVDGAYIEYLEPGGSLYLLVPCQNTVYSLTWWKRRIMEGYIFRDIQNREIIYYRMALYENGLVKLHTARKPGDFYGIRTSPHFKMWMTSLEMVPLKFGQFFEVA